MITVGIPLYNCASTIKAVLDQLTLQKIPNLQVIAYDNGSTDGTIGLMGELFARNYYLGKKSQEQNNLIMSFFTGIHDFNKHPYQNAMMTRKHIARLARTEFMFFLDADVLIQPYALPQLIKDFKSTKKCGELGIRYEPDSAHKHVMMGATLWKTEDFLKIPEFGDWDCKKSCDCNFCVKEVEKMGKVAMYHPDLSARHLKWKVI